MTSKQKQLYKWIITRNFKALQKAGSVSSFCNIVMELKKCCNHASLVDNQLEIFEEEHNLGEDQRLKFILAQSGKMLLLDKLLTKLFNTGHRVLIFSQMVLMLNVIAEYLQLKRYHYQRLDGSIQGEERRRAVDHFNAPNSEDFCFILSTRAGGLGINLTSADTVIIFDSDWNPQSDLQAQARAHRIGQKKEVNIYRFVTGNTVEEDIIEKAKKKMVLDHLVIQKMDTSGKMVLNNQHTKKSNSRIPFDKNELNQILKFGAEALFDDKDKDANNAHNDDVCDLDEILKRAETKKDEDENQQNSDDNQLMDAFSKVVDFDLKENDKTWNDIIPLEERLKAEQLEMEKLNQETLKPRNKSINSKLNEDELHRNALKNKEADGDEAEDDGRDPDFEDSDEDDDNKDPDGKPKTVRGPYKKWKPDKNDIIASNLSDKEIRRLVRSLRKIANPLERTEMILHDTELNLSIPVLNKVIVTLLGKLQNQFEQNQRCKDKKSRSKKSSRDDEKEQKESNPGDPNQKLKIGRDCEIHTNIAWTEISGLDAMHRLLVKKDGEIREEIELPIKPLKMEVDSSWGNFEDVELLKVCYKYGAYCWDNLFLKPIKDPPP